MNKFGKFLLCLSIPALMASTGCAIYYGIEYHNLDKQVIEDDSGMVNVVDELRKSVASLETEKANLTQQLTLLEEQYNSLIQLKQNLENTNNTLEKENADFQKQLAECDIQLGELAEQNSELQSRIEELQGQLDEFNIQNDELRNQLDDLANENLELQIRVEELENHIISITRLEDGQYKATIGYEHGELGLNYVDGDGFNAEILLKIGNGKITEFSYTLTPCFDFLDVFGMTYDEYLQEENSVFELTLVENSDIFIFKFQDSHVGCLNFVATIFYSIDSFSWKVTDTASILDGDFSTFEKIS